MAPIRRSLNALALLALCLVLSAPTQAAKRDLGKVAIASLLGTTCHFIHIGITVFTNAHYTAEVPDWAIDKDAEDFLTSTLGAADYQTGLLDVSAVPASQLYDPKQSPKEKFELLQHLAADQGFDTLIILSPSEWYNDRFIEPGFGIYSRIHTGPYASFWLQVRDVKSGKQIWGDFAYPSEAFPDKKLSWKAQWTDYSDEEQAAIRSGVERHIQNELLRILRGNHLIPPAK